MLPVFLALSANLGLVPEDPFYVCGIMTSLLAPNARIAPVSNGLPVVVRIAPDGTATQESTSIKGNDWGSSAAVRLTNLTYEGGKLTATVALENGSGSPLLGIRLDLASVTESYVNDQGVAQSRPQVATCVPPFLGDLGKGEQSDSVPLSVSGLKIEGKTTGLKLNFVVSGLRYTGGFSDPEKDLWAEGMVFAPDGRLVIAGGQRQVIFSCDREGKDFKVINPENDLAPIRVTASGNELWVIRVNAHGAERYSVSGQLLGRFPEKDTEGWVFNVRSDSTGAAYMNHSGSILKFVGGKQVAVINGDDNLVDSYAPYEIDKKGLLWIATEEGLITMTQTGQRKTIASRGQWKLGALQNDRINQAFRMDPSGQFYVGEEGDTDTKNARISVFDHEGRIVRVFGRGARTQSKGDQASNPGQILTPPRDFAFGKDGRVYVSHGSHEQGILIYRPF